MREYSRPEEYVPGELRDLESQTEQIERKLEDLETSIEALEASIADLEHEGDEEIARSLQRNLSERMQEKREQEEEARAISGELQNVSREIQEVDSWNNEASRQVSMLAKLGEHVEEAEQRLAAREQWVEEQSSQRRALQERLGRILRQGFG